MKAKDYVKTYKSVSRDMFKDIKRRNSIFISKKYKKPKYKGKLEDYLDELIEYEEWEEMNENRKIGV